MSMLKARVAALMAKIGVEEGTAAKLSQDSLDTLMHEYNVASAMFSIAEKRKDAAKSALIKGLSTDAAQKLSKKIAVVKATEVSDRIDLGAGQHYALSAKVNIGATFLDDKSLLVELMKQFGTDQANALMDRHRKRRDPSVTYEAVELDPE